MRLVLFPDDPALKVQLDQRVRELSDRGQLGYFEITLRWRRESGLERSGNRQLDLRWEVIVEEIPEGEGRAVLALIDLNANPQTVEVIGILPSGAKAQERDRLLGMRLGTYRVTR